MPVMKAREAQRTRPSAIVMDLSDLEVEAGAIVARARQQAAKIVAEAQAAAEQDGLRLRDEARHMGREEGLQAGAQAGREQGHQEAVAKAAAGLAELVENWSQALQVFQQNMPVHMADAKTDLVRLALAVAERVTHQEALRNAQVAEATVEETLRMVGSAQKVVLHVNPAELERLEKYVPALLAKVRSVELVKLVADETVTVGGCVVRFGEGEVDGRLETQLQRIATELLAGQ